MSSFFPSVTAQRAFPTGLGNLSRALDIAASELLPLLNLPLADAFDNDLMHTTLKNIVEGKTVEVPTYDFVTHSR